MCNKNRGLSAPRDAMLHADRPACVFDVQIGCLFSISALGNRGLSALRDAMLHADLHLFFMCRFYVLFYVRFLSTLRTRAVKFSL
jgi:hypothetical protein